ncbi:hypothetical protein SAMN06297144_0226 [Sphingomonas guangdongensis]|uniref:Uncharacterized protein n=1 Tax=Sphingomonas guangdongensis TaxID=1141890 RepID=A0A285QA54_9SPHN|nr:hypothetical protein [Sphingomonas guangdongensis]SOB78810.1 hypothetical protein SAMN06297144_0226 [Sphingomonas guangdongensis]
MTDGGTPLSRVIVVDALMRQAALDLGVASDPALVDASASISRIYAGLLDAGADQAEVALAALGAMIGLFDHAGLLAELPAVLRQAADTIEDEQPKPAPPFIR